VKTSKRVLVLILLLAGLLRLWRLSEVPVSLFGDELDVGYQAYSILKTGRDYYGNYMPLHFHSLAEWRTPLYLYSVVPTVGLFGISPLGVRLPAAIFGILGVYVFYLLTKELFEDERFGLLSAFVLAISPWHIQYSRAAFEVTQLLFFLILGLFFFFKALKNGRWLWLSAVCFSLTPWVYSTAKLFVPMLILFLVVVWWKDLLGLKGKYLLRSAVVFVIVGGPMVYSVLFGGAAQRFGYVSVFTNPSTEHEVGVARLNDAQMRGERGTGISPRIDDRALHNKYVYWGENLISNYFRAFSTEFLFISGDPNLRHSIKGMGQLYRVEAFVLLLGLIWFFTSKIEKKKKLLIVFWLMAGAVPAAITRDGGNHATRLILILPPLGFLIAYGISRLNRFWLVVFGAMLMVNFGFYEHDYWVHNPWNSERWWHSGFREAISEIKSSESDYDRIVISTANEPPWIFFAAWYEYTPEKWQAEFPIGNDVDLPGFGKVSHIDKFYFGSLGVGLYEMGKILDSKTLYIASEKEVNVNLIAEPERLPGDLILVKAIAYPSGEPVFYLFSGK